MATLTVNGKPYTVNVPADTPLLWVIREHLQLTGTKFGCGLAQCGACTVHLDGTHAVWYGARCFGRYDARGRRLPPAASLAAQA